MFAGGPGGVFVGREHELRVLRADVEDALRGRGRLVLLAGEPGIGKTRTCQELAAYAREHGAQVLWGRCYEGEGAPAFWPWVQVLRAGLNHFETAALQAVLGASAVELAPIVPGLREQWPDLPSSDPSDSPEARFRLFDSVAGFLSKLAQRAPLLVVIDDLHGADRSSLLLLEFVTRGLRELPLLVLGTHRDVGGRSAHPLTETLVDVARQPSTERLVLRGLSADEIAEFIRTSAGVEPPAVLVTLLHERTEGNPLFVSEFVQVLLSEGRLAGGTEGGWNVTVPSTVQAVIGRRLAPLSEVCREVLRTAAVVGREFHLNVLEGALAEGKQAQLIGALEEAVAAQVLQGLDASGRGRFAHALIRETLFEELGTVRRQQLHRTVGESIERLDADEGLAELVYHFFEAGENEKTVAYAQRAGDRALGMLAYEEAVRLYERGMDALRRLPGEDAHERQRCDLLLGLGEAQNGAARTAESKETILRAADIARGLRLREHFSRAALVYGVQLVWGEAGVTDTTLVGLLEEAIAFWGSDDSALHARLLGRLATALYYLPVEARRASLCDAAVTMARRIGDRGALAFALNAQHAAGWGPDNQAERLAIATELKQLAEAAGDRHLVFQAHFWRANDSLELGDFDAFDTDLNTCARLADELRRPYYDLHVALFEAARAAILGRFDDAQRFTAAAHAAGMEWYPAVAQFGTGFHALNRAVLRGEPLDGLVAFLEASIAQHPGVPAMRCFLARVYAELGRDAPARHEFNRVAAAGFADLPRDGNLLPMLSFLSDVCAFLGDTERAAILYELLDPYAERAAIIGNVGVYFGCGAQCLGKLAATMSRWDDAVRHFKDAIAFNIRMHARPQLALTQHAYARALFARGTPGDRETASSLLAAALDTARDLGMRRLDEKITRLLEGTQRAATGDVRSATESPKPAPGDRSAEPNLFRREGGYWTIAFAGTLVRLKDNKGLQFIAHLLRHPGQEFLALDLVDFGVSNADRGAAPQIAIGAPALDAEAKRAYKERLHELRDELEEAERFNDFGRAAQLQAEMHFIGEQLSAAVGRHGKDRKAGGAAERARLMVTKRIKGALTTIGAVHPQLAHHLRACVKTGYLCSYTPPPDRRVAWQF
ncbi:MAG TPA: AAA family ATPase [Candidatus Acidoferrales bacterium]|nr:AAA family ATPase [Candidatus Acidoferrales bacterium]